MVRTQRMAAVRLDELIGAPWVAQHDSIRVYAGPIQISQNVEIRAVARRNGYNYVSGNWGSDVTILQTVRS